MLWKNHSVSAGLLFVAICTLSGVVISGLLSRLCKQAQPDGPVEGGHHRQAGREGDREASRQAGG